MSLQENNIKAILSKEKTVVSVASELHVSRQTIHKWLLRYKRYGIDGLRARKRKYTKRVHNRTSEEVEILIVHLAEKYWKDGVLTLADRLEDEYTIVLHPSTLYRILKRNNARYTETYIQTKKR